MTEKEKKALTFIAKKLGQISNDTTFSADMLWLLNQPHDGLTDQIIRQYEQQTPRADR